jgi:hypothetical protein
MQTEESLKEIIRETRRKLFWRLWVLPWIISIIILLGVVLWSNVQIKEIHERKADWIADCIEEELQFIREKNEEKEIILGEGISQGILMIQKEAIKRGYAYWTVEGETLGVQFNWANIPGVQDQLAIEDIPLKKGIVKDTIPVNRYRDVPFTYTDLEFARDLGIDFEQDLIGSVMVTVQNIFDTIDSDISKRDLHNFEKKIKGEITETIHQRFDGFETYKKVK